MNVGGPRPVPPVGAALPVVGARAAGSLQSGVLLDLAESGTGQALPWREGDAVSARILASGRGQAVLQFGQAVVTAKTGLALPPGAYAQLVVRRMRGPRIELQLVAVDRAADGQAAAAVPGQAGHVPLPTTAWQLAFVVPGHGEASVTAVPGRDEDEQRQQDATAENDERIVIRWESTHLGEVELELDVAARTADGQRPVRLAARAGAGSIAALRSGLAGLGERLGELGFVVQTRTVGPLRRKRPAAAAAVRLDTRL